MAALSFKKTLAIAALPHIVFLCSRLDVPGGIERAIVNTANLFAAKGYRVTLLVLEASEAPFFPLRGSVEPVAMPLSFGIHHGGNPLSRKMNFVADVRTLRGRLKSLLPNLVIATEYSYAVAAILAYQNRGAALFAWEHHHFGHLKKNRFWRFLQKRLYPKLTAVICLNPAEAAYHGAMKCKTVVIPNFCDAGSPSLLQAKNLLTVGWLSKTKGVRAIPALAEKVFASVPDWQWTVIGTGAEENFLREELAKRNLQHRVPVFSPSSSDLAPVYLNSSLYVMTSQFECFPMVLLEALSHGVPCVAFDCPTGPRFIITAGSDGLLVAPNDLDALAAGIIAFIGNKEKRRAFGNAAHQNVRRFSAEKVFSLWEEFVLTNAATK